nr:uncharacterized protein LOC116432160 isoform X1 [Nomia melanderi]
MDTSTCSFAGQTTTQVGVQRKFYQWVLRWINGLQTDESNDELRHDLPILAGFFQAIGYKLHSFEKRNTEEANESNASASRPGILKVTIECGSSKMRAILESRDVPCRCPNPDHVQDASFWSISGTGPVGSTDNIPRKVEETGSNLLPRLSKEVTRVLRDVSQRLFDTIAGEPDMNRNTDVSLNISCSSNEVKVPAESVKREMGVTRSHTQPEICLRANSWNTKPSSESNEKDHTQTSVSRNATPSRVNKFALQRQKTWDIDIESGSLEGEPRPSPPKLTSSPTIFDELSSSLGQISLQGEETSKGLTEYITEAKRYLEKALKVLNEKSVSSDDACHTQDDCTSVKSAPANMLPTIVVSSLKRSRTITGIKPSARLEQNKTQALVKPASGNAPRMLNARRSMDTMNSHSSTRKSTPVEQGSIKPSVRRNSFYIPSSKSILSLPAKSTEVGQKLLTTGKPGVGTKTTVSPESRISTPKKKEALNTLVGRTSMIKPPTKISKAIPVKIKPVEPSKLSTGIAKNSRSSLSKE